MIKRTEIDAEAQTSVCLPACVETRSDGAIAIRGHRVTLFVLLSSIYDDATMDVDQLQSAFPTIPRQDLLEVIRFSSDARARAYYEQQRQSAEKNRTQVGMEGPSMEELRRRREARRPKR